MKWGSNGDGYIFLSSLLEVWGSVVSGTLVENEFGAFLS